MDKDQDMVTNAISHLEDGGGHLHDASSAVSKQEGQFEKTELDQKRFSVWAVIGVQFSCSAAPLSICSYTYLVNGVGGQPYFFWCYLVAVVGQLLVAASLAEIAAVYPHTSGQVFWTACLAPPRFAHFLSNFIGSLTFFGWTLGTAGTVVFTGNFLSAFGVVVNPDYVPEQWHIYLIALANTALAVLLNTIGIRFMSGINKFMVVFLNAAAIYIFIVLLAKTSPKASAYDVFVKVVNETGWSSDGFVFLLGFLPGVLTVTLPDSPAHATEEVERPQRSVPLVMFGTSVLNAVAGFIMCTALVFCTIKPEDLTDPLADQPIFQIAVDAWNNHGWVITVALIFVVVPLNGALAILLGASRILWSFARAGGVFGHDFLSRTNATFQVPVNAVCFTALLVALLALLEFSPSTVLNGIFGSSAILLITSYSIPIFLMIRQRQRQRTNGLSLPKHYFNLGLMMGTVINAAALTWLLLCACMLSFPIYYPVTVDNMNWAAPVAAGLACVALINWFGVRSHWELPKPLLIVGL